MGKWLDIAGLNERYFHFDNLVELMHKIEDLALFAILCFLVYIWVKLFLYWDKQ